MYDVIIIGSGPAGLAAAIYAKRAALETLVLEKTPLSGGQIINTYEVDNYPGLPGISGMELGQKMRGHVDAEEAEVKTATVTAIEDKQDQKVVHTNQGDFETRTVVLAMGASHRQLGVPGEEDLCGMGVSYCATCDGAFFKNLRKSVVREEAPEQAPAGKGNFGKLDINPDRYEVRKDGRIIDLTVREFELLKYLSAQKGQVFSRETLLEKVWGYEYFGDVRTVDVTIRRLREKIEDDPGKPVYILTKRGVGYYFDC